MDELIVTRSLHAFRPTWFFLAASATLRDMKSRPTLKKQTISIRIHGGKSIAQYLKRSFTLYLSASWRMGMTLA